MLDISSLLGYLQTVKLLTENNHKILKGKAHGYLTFILHLAPSILSGHNVCPKASEGCKAACLNTAGRGVYAKSQRARIRKTRELFDNRAAFAAQLRKDVVAGIRRAKKLGLTPCFRLNGTSDLPFDYLFPEIFREFPTVQFYDYTKLVSRMFRHRPANYHLTFSLSETNSADAERVLAAGYNVAVVFHKVPETYMGYRVVCGDTTDLRFLDPSGVIIGLTAKGRGKRDTSGFVK